MFTIGLMKRSHKGLGVVEIILVLVLISAVGAIGWYVYQALKSINHTYDSATATSSRAAPKFGSRLNQSLATLSGTITAGPVSPVTKLGDPNVAVVANHGLQLKNAQGNVVLSSKTDSQGKYLFHVSPGNYTVVLTPPIGLGVLKNNAIRVVAGANRLDLVADTGIR